MEEKREPRSPRLSSTSGPATDSFNGLHPNPEEDSPKRDDANKVVLKTLAPAGHVEDLLKMLRDASRSVGVVTGDPYGPAKGLRAALEITDALLARIPEVHNERKRMVAACEAFRKVLAKGLTNLPP